MTKFRTSEILVMANESTLSLLKNACMDFDEIIKVVKDISGTPIPEELQEKLDYENKFFRSNCWDFTIYEESSWGMKFMIETRYGPDFDFFEYLCYKFPDLRVRIEYSSYDTDGTYDIVYIARTRNGKVEVQSAVWDEDYLAGCGYGDIPDFYKKYSPGLLLKKPEPVKEIREDLNNKPVPKNKKIIIKAGTKRDTAKKV
jgi:hypothetical protein